jgi:hypothetical protein
VRASAHPANRESLLIFAAAGRPAQSAVGKTSETTDYPDSFEAPMHGSQIQQIRQLVTAAFYRHGSTDPLAETLLVSEGRYFGRKYSANGLQAIWLREKGLIEVLDLNCRLVEAIMVGQSEMAA